MRQKKEYLMAFLAIIAVLGFFAGMALLAYGQAIPKDNREYFALGFGTLIALASKIYEYFYGSSKNPSPPPTPPTIEPPDAGKLPGS